MFPAPTPARPLAVALSVVLFGLLTVACSPEQEANNDPTRPQTQRNTAGETTSPPDLETTEGDSSGESTLGLSSGKEPEAVLRLEGDPNTRFSGICDVGDEENVLSGQVPKRFGFNLNGTGISCRIQKQDRGDGSLRVILLADNTTRSVQQTDTPDGTIEISYRGN